MKAFIAKLAIFTQVIFLACFFVLPFIPEFSLSILIEYLFLFSPRWAWFALLPLSVLGWRNFGFKSRLFILIWFVITLIFQDLGLPMFKSNYQQSQSDVTLLNFNAGAGASAEQLSAMVKQYQPQIVVMQESSDELTSHAFNPTWNSHCDGGLCIACRGELEILHEINRDLIRGWGIFLSTYKVNLYTGLEVTLFNVHFETPRHILTDLINRSADLTALEQLHYNRDLQASILSSLIDKESNYIVAGDFNMTVEERIYKRHFADQNNALSSSSGVINYTKYTSFHGVRIDHILTSDSIDVKSAEVLPTLGGDHRPVLVKLL